jgi:hypothetical protein
MKVFPGKGFENPHCLSTRSTGTPPGSPGSQDRQDYRKDVPIYFIENVGDLGSLAILAGRSYDRCLNKAYFHSLSVK